MKNLPLSRILLAMAALAKMSSTSEAFIHGKQLIKKKYVDDLSLLESLYLQRVLVPSAPIIGPPNEHEQSGLHLPPNYSILQHQLADLLDFTNSNKMKINFKKMKILPFNTCKKYEFLPHINFPNSEPLEVIYFTRLLSPSLVI